ncbi:histidine phosphatase family protein [Schumannella sp. 10F1B-5-1]|uniref:histidine phosphatase family protein n=1 Tax=Schumannella sp. 10F1B-5-1 TaxID=2590780 RepID=UPI0015E8351B|nr:histidine phosphatase family protein [Schumannella sp. 10F1B-5-1]
MIALVRHGETDWNAAHRMQGSSDIPLNDTGRQQARDAAELFVAERAAGEHDWAAVVSSSAIRARETGEIIAARLEVPFVRTYPQWFEQHFGDAEGVAVEEALRRWPNRDPKGRESDALLKVRALGALEQVADDFAGQDVIVAAHGTIIRTVLMELSGQELGFLPNASASRLSAGENGWVVHTFGGEPLVVELEVESA